QPHRAPERRHRTRNWVPWAVIVGVIAIALAIALPLTLGGSSSSATPTPPSPSTLPSSAAADVGGSYLTPAITDSRLFFVTLARGTGDSVNGKLAVTVAGPTHKHLLTHRYNLSGTVSGTTLHLNLSTAIAGVATITGTYNAGTITFIIGTTTIHVRRGTLTEYKLLVKTDRSALLG
ncbi:MAG: hypothetical protein WAM97_01805, partial [Acidimicrobiales bacterium]